MKIRNIINIFKFNKTTYLTPKENIIYLYFYPMNLLGKYNV